MSLCETIGNVLSLPFRDRYVLSLQPAKVKLKKGSMLLSLPLVRQQQIRPHSEPPVCEERDINKHYIAVVFGLRHILPFAYD